MKPSNETPFGAGAAHSDLLTRRQAAAYLGVAEQTLAVWKCTGRYYLPWIKIGRLVRYHAAAGDPKYGHFGALRWLLLTGPKRLAEVLRNSPSELARMEFEGWMRLSGETDFRYGVFSGLITKLNPWMTDQMVALTETTDIDLDALKNRLFTFYLSVPSRSRDSKLIGSLMLNFLLDHILELKDKADLKHPVAMLLDEFTNFGKIAGIADTLSIIRKNKIGLVLGFQNYFQLEQIYSRREAQIIIDMPATQVYFKQKTFAEARDLSEAIGRTTIEEASVNDSGRVHEIIQGRALITPDELISLKNEVIVFTADTKPLKLPLTSPTAYEQALSYDQPERERHKVSDFILRRGDIARAQDANANESEQNYREKSGNPSRNSARFERTNRQQSKTNPSNESKDRTNNRKPGETRGRPGRTPPDYGD